MSATYNHRPRFDFRLGVLLLVLVVSQLQLVYFESILLGFVGLLFVALGLPHGALDIWVAEQSVGKGVRGVAIAAYVGLVLMMALAWLSVPIVAYVGFLLLSVHHIGEGDLPDSSEYWTRIARGTFMVGVPLLAHQDSVNLVLDPVGAAVVIAPSVASTAIAVLVGLNVVAVWFGAARLDTKSRLGEAAYVVLWTVAFVSLNPLISFGLYFTLWHSLDYLRELEPRFGRRQPAEAGRAWLRGDARSRWLIFAVLPNVALGAAVLVLNPPVAEFAGRFATVAIVIASSLTLPHALVVSLSRHTAQFRPPVDERAAIG